jgi:hypothetical protein
VPSLRDALVGMVRPLGHVEGTNGAGGSRGRRRRAPFTPCDQGLRARAGDGNRTRITSLEDWPAGFRRTSAERFAGHSIPHTASDDLGFPRPRDGRAMEMVNWERRFDSHLEVRRAWAG